MFESAFIVRAPEAEPHVSHYRERYDASAKLGVPAHITVLYPFMPPMLINTQVLEQVRLAVSNIRGFAFHLTKVGRFPDAVYLMPQPSDPFVSLTHAIVRAFPSYPPYRGQHAAVIPHLTVAQVEEPRQSAVAAELRSSLERTGSIASYCSELILIENSTGRWKQRHAFTLTAPASADG